MFRRKNFVDGSDSTRTHDGGAAAVSDPVMEIPALARRAVETFVAGGRILETDPHDATPILSQKSACFVCIKTTGRVLRGCIGTIEPEKESLREEIVANAVKAATLDPRFLPVACDELPLLTYSVDVLEPPEPASAADLDPAVFGVVVVNLSGTRRGLLLPDIEGVDTPGRQINIAARKAGISTDEPHRLYRFRVRRFKESA